MKEMTRTLTLIELFKAGDFKTAFEVQRVCHVHQEVKHQMRYKIHH